MRPCCRMNLLSPIHVPIQQEAFEEVAKTVQISNPLMDSQMTPVSVSIPEIPEEGPEIPKPDFYDGSTPLIQTFPEPLVPGECELPKKKEVWSLAKLDIPTELPDVDIEEVGAAEEGREERVHVGAGRIVTRKGRRYRAR